MRGQFIEFDNKDRMYGCCGYSVTFEFSNNSITYLFNIISNMRYIDEKYQHRKKVIKLGSCIKNVSLTHIIQLIRLADRKIDVAFDDGILVQMMKDDPDFRQSVAQPTAIDNKEYEFDEHLIIDMVRMS